MSDIIRLIEIIDKYPAVWVTLLYTALALLGVWREWVFTRGRHMEVVKEREWWRERALRLEQELKQDTEYRQRVITALETLADLMHLNLKSNDHSWLNRWRP